MATSIENLQRLLTLEGLDDETRKKLQDQLEIAMDSQQEASTEGDDNEARMNFLMNLNPVDETEDQDVPPHPAPLAAPEHQQHEIVRMELPNVVASSETPQGPVHSALNMPRTSAPPRAQGLNLGDSSHIAASVSSSHLPAPPAPTFPPMVVGMATGQTPAAIAPPTTFTPVQDNVAPGTSSRPIAEMVSRPPHQTSGHEIVDVSEFFNPHLEEPFAILKDHQMLKQTSEAWSNDNLKDLETINLDLWTKIEPDDQVKLAEIALNSLCDRVSVASVGVIMMCAWGVYSVENKANYAMAHLWDFVKTSKSVEYTALPNEITCVALSPNKYYTKEILRGPGGMITASFYCAALLRVFTKDSGSFELALPSLAEQFHNFYEAHPAFQIKVDKRCLEHIRKLFHNRIILRNSLAPFLLAFLELSDNNKGLCKLLYEIHLGFTGMHCYNLAISNAFDLSVPFHTFFGFLNHHQNTTALKKITEIITTYESSKRTDEEKKKTATWIYARIFNSKMFCEIQTKNCRFLTSLLAVMADKLGRSDSKNKHTDIIQIASFVNEHRSDLDEWANRIIKCCNAGVWADIERRNKIFSISTHRKV